MFTERGNKIVEGNIEGNCLVNVLLRTDQGKLSSDFLSCVYKYMEGAGNFF